MVCVQWWWWWWRWSVLDCVFGSWDGRKHKEVDQNYPAIYLQNHVYTYLSIYIFFLMYTHTSISLDKFAAIHPFIQKQPLRWEWFLHDQVGTNEFSRFLSKVWPETIKSVIFYKKKKLTPCYSHEGQKSTNDTFEARANDRLQPPKVFWCYLLVVVYWYWCTWIL